MNDRTPQERYIDFLKNVRPEEARADLKNLFIEMMKYTEGTPEEELFVELYHKMLRPK